MMTTPRQVQVQSKVAARLKLAREWHLYLGTFFAPSILFFALTGTLQIFGLHQARPGGAYQPPVWIQKLASIHKHQNIATEKRTPPPGFAGERTEPHADADQQKAPAAAQEAKPPSRSQEGTGSERSRPDKARGSMIPMYLLKWFFVLMALSLAASTLSGIYMAFKFNRSRTLVWSLLLLGLAIPVALVAMMA